MVTDAAEPKPKKPRRRVTRRTLARRKRVQEAQRLERLQKAAARQAEFEARQKERWQIAYDAQIAHEHDREARRIFQENGVRWLMWSETGNPAYDGPETQQFEQRYQESQKLVLEARRRAKSAGDLLNITAPKPVLTKKEKRAAERKAAKKAQEELEARGEERGKIPDPDNMGRPVWVTYKKTRKRTLLKQHHLHGVDLFVRDVEALSGGGMRSPAMGDKVDSSGSPAIFPHLVKSAQNLEMCYEQVGEKNMLWAIAYLFMGTTPADVHADGGSQHTTGSARVQEALDQICAFYDRAYVSKDRDLNLLRQTVAAGMEVIRQANHELNWPIKPKKPKKWFGSIKTYDPLSQIGFATCASGATIPFHAIDFPDEDVPKLKVGDKLMFEIRITESGPRAINMKRL